MDNELTHALRYDENAKSEKITIFASGFSGCVLTVSSVYAGPITAKVNPKSTTALKEFMLRLGVVLQMQQADKKGDYKIFTETLSKYVADMKTLSQKHSRKVFKVYEELSQTCMQCHAVNREPDYIKHYGESSKIKRPISL